MEKLSPSDKDINANKLESELGGESKSKNENFEKKEEKSEQPDFENVIKLNQEEIDRLENVIEMTKNQISGVWEKLGVEHSEEDPPSVKSYREKISRLKEEQEEIRRKVGKENNSEKDHKKEAVDIEGVLINKKIDEAIPNIEKEFRGGLKTLHERIQEAKKEKNEFPDKHDLKELINENSVFGKMAEGAKKMFLKAFKKYDELRSPDIEVFMTKGIDFLNKFVIIRAVKEGVSGYYDEKRKNRENNQMQN